MLKNKLIELPSNNANFEIISDGQAASLIGGCKVLENCTIFEGSCNLLRKCGSFKETEESDDSEMQ